MTTTRKQSSKKPISVQPSKLESSNNLKLLRFSELDADFTRQTKRLARIVSKFKKDITSKIS